MKNLGAKRWAIAEGYIPGYSHGEAPQLTSHETVCILNAGDTEAEVTITIFYTDREPGGPYRLKIPARRTQHVRSEEHTSELQSRRDLVCRLLLEKKKKKKKKKNR